jgi:hypothetical protein
MGIIAVRMVFYDSKRSIGFVWFLFFTTRRGVLVSCGFLLFLRLEEEYWFRAVFCFYSFSSF